MRTSINSRPQLALEAVLKLCTRATPEPEQEAPEISLVVVGGGPTCTYIVERLAAVFRQRPPRRPLTMHVFDRDGDFGSGQAHSSRQPRSSVLNRICGQISFGADSTHPSVAATPSLAPFKSLHEWCMARFAVTQDPQYQLDPDSWPRRFLHGLALEEVFATYVDCLNNVPNVSVRLHEEEVVDVAPLSDGRLSVVAGRDRVDADHIVFATGHGAALPRPGGLAASLAALSAQGCGAFIPYTYPLEKRIPLHAADNTKVVCSLGLGLTAIDLILYLTEGRGGEFVNGDQRLTYRRSGAEPLQIVGCSQSGLFTYARARNEKEADPAALEHKGVFFTELSVDRLRETAGKPMDIPNIGVRRQLDFERHLFPLLLLEMTYLYYKTLLGVSFAQVLEEAVAPEVERFLAAPNSSGSEFAGFAAVLDPLIENALGAIAHYLPSDDYVAAEARYEGGRFDLLLGSYLRAAVGLDLTEENPTAAPTAFARAKRTRESARQSDPFLHRFDWNDLCNPIPESSYEDSDSFQAAVVNFMTIDHRRAAEGNVHNPWKAACDGVWRDLRTTLTYAVDRGGLTAQSHQIFLSRYLRLHNRLANGACLEVMEKMLALVRCGLLDVGLGPLVSISSDNDGRGYCLTGLAGTRRVDTIVDAKLHLFDPEFDESQLYRQIYSRSLVRRWRNPCESGGGFEPGGIDVSDRFHPFDAEGNEDTRITFLGPPTEGLLFFQVGAARPNQNHHVLKDVITWVEEFEDRILAMTTAGT